MSVTPIHFDDLIALIDNTTQSPVIRKEYVDLYHALGRVLAEPLVAKSDAPAFTNAAMDGYAWRTKDFEDYTGTSEVALPVQATITAGHSLTDPLPPRSCVRIMTGAELPPGFDCVVPIEKAHLGNGQLLIKPADHMRGENVRFQGELYHAGDVLLDEGTRLTREALGLIAANGIANVPCRLLRVALFASGDELLEPGTPSPHSGAIYNANGIEMTLLVAETGASPSYLGILPDNPDTIRTKLLAAMVDHDVIVCSGGVGPGDHDYTAKILSEFGEMHHFHVAMKPGKPFTYANLEGEHPVFFIGLPGNPVATLTAGTFFMQRILSRLMKAPYKPQAVKAVLYGAPLMSKDGRTDFVRGRLFRGTDGTLMVQPAPVQSSATLLACANTNAIIHITEHQTRIEVGDSVEVIPTHL